jgi:hypothetical protein
MPTRQLEIVELREKAFSAREKAERARRLATHVTHAPSARVLELHVAEFEAKAAILDREVEELEEQDPRTSEPAPTILERPDSNETAAANVRRWRAKAEEIRTAADSMSRDAACHTPARLARDYDAIAERAEGAAKSESRKRDQDAG